LAERAAVDRHELIKIYRPEMLPSTGIVIEGRLRSSSIGGQEGLEK